MLHKGVWRFVLGAAVAACLYVAFIACATVKPMGGAVAGAAVGSPLGPVGVGVGAAAGAGVGALWQEVSSAQDDRAACLVEQERLHTALEDLRATIKANAQIDAYNATATRKVPHTDPSPSEPSSFSLAWKALLLGLVALAAWIFRREVWAWTKRAAIYLASLLARTRAPSPAPIEPAPRATPLNPEP